MAQITRVQKARQRTDADGNPKPNLVCDRDDTEIKPGDPYKHISVRTGPRSSAKLVRCVRCPDWQVWEYSNSLSARVAEIVHNFRQVLDEDFGDTSDVESARDDAVNAIRELAEEKEEGAGNIEDGFGHETTQSGELREQAESLVSWADEIEGVEIPELSDPEDEDCVDCDGTGKVDDPEDNSDDPKQVDCDNCEGTGEVTPEEPSEEEYETWREEVRDAFSIIDESPV